MMTSSTWKFCEKKSFKYKSNLSWICLTLKLQIANFSLSLRSFAKKTIKTQEKRWPFDFFCDYILMGQLSWHVLQQKNIKNDTKNTIKIIKDETSIWNEKLKLIYETMNIELDKICGYSN